MNELQLLKITDVDVQRNQIHIRLGKGKKDRYVGLSKFIARKLPLYMQEVKPQVYLFEGLTPAEPMGERSIQYIIIEALQKNNIKKQVSMHTLRHSYATHLLEDGIDIHTIQHLLDYAAPVPAFHCNSAARPSAHALSGVYVSIRQPIGRQDYYWALPAG